MIHQENYVKDKVYPYHWGVATDVGLLRQKNEDSYLIDAEVGLFLVSDGMGGHMGGALASKIVAEDLPVLIETRLNKLPNGSPKAIRKLLRETIEQQNHQLHVEGASESGYYGMGATVVLALIRAGRAYIANVGDSRAYRLRGGRLAQLNKDHSLVAELVTAGHIEPKEAINHAARGVITQHVGMETKTKPYIRSFALKKGDRLLLCSDGVTDMIPDDKLEELLSTISQPRDLCRQLVHQANKAGGHDNITAAVIDWEN